MYRCFLLVNTSFLIDALRIQHFAWFCLLFPPMTVHLPVQKVKCDGCSQQYQCILITIIIVIQLSIYTLTNCQSVLIILEYPMKMSNCNDYLILNCFTWKISSPRSIMKTSPSFKYSFLYLTSLNVTALWKKNHYHIYITKVYFHAPQEQNNGLFWKSLFLIYT